MKLSCVSFQVCPRGERTNLQKVCERCTESPELYDWLYLGFMAMLPLVLHWFFIEWYSGKKRCGRVHILSTLSQCDMCDKRPVDLVQFQCPAAAHYSHAGVQCVSSDHTAGHWTCGNAQHPFLPCPDAVRLVHHAVQPQSRLHQHLTLYSRGSLSTVSTNSEVKSKSLL